MKGLKVLVLIIVVSAAGWYLFARGTGDGNTSLSVPAPGSVNVDEMVVKDDGMVEAGKIVVEGDEFSFSPSSINVRAGEKVTLTFNNVGKFPHNLSIEGLGIVTKTIGVGESDTITFTVDEGGIYSTYCSVGNHRAQGMEGELSVE